MGDGPVADIEIGDVRRGRGGRYADLYATRDTLRGHRRLILVHGFNTSPEAALQTYGGFCRLVRSVAPKLESDIRTLTWPGRAPYPTAVDRARDTVARAVGRYIGPEAWRQPRQLAFIGHSLGCRLVLESLNRLRPAQRFRILPRTRLYLLAAAVPTSAVAIGGHLRSVLGRCDRSEVFYSKDDLVLRLLFRPGQIPERRAWTPAVGLRGEPAEFWGRRRHDMTPFGFGHGHYWRSEMVAYRIALSLRAAERRPMSRQMMRSRDLESPRALPQRPLGGRRLPATRRRF